MKNILKAIVNNEDIVAWIGVMIIVLTMFFELRADFNQVMGTNEPNEFDKQVDQLAEDADAFCDDIFELFELN